VARVGIHDLAEQDFSPDSDDFSGWHSVIIRDK
jgi:hypothetical protein